MKNIQLIISIIGTASLFIIPIIGIALIWMDEKYEHILLKSFCTCALIFFFCWLITPKDDSEFDQED